MSEPITYKIRELDLEQIAPSTKDLYNKKNNGGSKIVCIGKPGSGKSTLIASIMYAKKHIFPTALILSGTEDVNNFYKKIIPSTFVYNEYNEDAIKSFIKRQKLAKEYLPNPWSLLLCDDCIENRSVLNSSLQQGLFKKGRHYACLYILSLQYCLDPPPAVRTNIDYTFILREPMIKTRRSLWENFASIIPDFTLFCKLMDVLTDNYGALVICNRTVSNDWHECVFYYKADLLPKNFKFGSQDFIDFHEARYNSEYVEKFDTL